jgi:hypothetical protein
MKHFRQVLALGGLFALCGCVVAPPSAPQVMALPSQNKDFATFQQEDAGCRATASQVIGVPPPAPGAAAPPPVPVAVAAEMQQRFDVAYTQCMYSHGNQVTQPPAPAVYADYYGAYGPYYAGYGYGFGPYFGLGIGFGGYYGGYYRGYGGRYYGGFGGGYRGGYGGGFHGGGGFGGGGFHH